MLSCIGGYSECMPKMLGIVLATAMSIYGHILKIDSTKKVVKKLQGAAAGTATWVINVGNEKGEVLISVVTESEGLFSLKPMAEGLMIEADFNKLEQTQFFCIIAFVVSRTTLFFSSNFIPVNKI